MGSVKSTFNGILCKVGLWFPSLLNRPEANTFWMPDDSCRLCYNCEISFTIFNRRHHCRVCGRVFCGRCTSNTIPASSVDGWNHDDEGERLRVCEYCYRLWADREELSQAGIGAAGYDEGIQSSAALSPSASASSLVSSNTPSSTSSGENHNHNNNISTMPFSTVPYQHITYNAPHNTTKNSDSNPVQKDAADFLNQENPVQSFEKHPDSFISTSTAVLHRIDDVDEYCYNFNKFSKWQLSKSIESYKRGNISEALSPDIFPPNPIQNPQIREVAADETGSLDKQENVLNDIHHESQNNSNYNIEGSQGSLDNYERSNESSMFASENAGNPDKDMDIIHNFQLYQPPEPEDTDDENETSFVEDDDYDDNSWGLARSHDSFSDNEGKNKEKTFEEYRTDMRSVVDGHFRALVAQLLKGEDVPIGGESSSDNWLEIVTRLSWMAANYVKPDTSKGGGMDPAGYVKVKCVAHGRQYESELIKGIVCSKNVADRRMNTRCKNARLLLLGGALEYQRQSVQLSSLDTLIQQEMQHLNMTVSKIDAHHPNVLLVEKTVSRPAREYLLQKKIAFVLNVKRSLMERIARCTGAQIVPSIDHLSATKVGRCEDFHVEKILEEHGSAGQQGKKLVKTLMFFDGCPKRMGCTVLLKGANGDELKKIKRVVQYAIFAAYHLAMETSFLADEGANFTGPVQPSLSLALPDKQSNLERSISVIHDFLTPTSENASVSDMQTELLASKDSLAINNLSERERPESMTNCGGARLSASPNLETYPVHSPMTYVSSIHENSAVNVDPGIQSKYSNTLKCNMSTTGAILKPSFELSSSLAQDSEEAKSTANLNSNEQDLHVFDYGKTNSCSEVSDQSFPQELDRKELNDQVFSEAILDRKTSSNSQEEFPPSPSDQQSILVILSTRAIWKGTQCQSPHLLRIKYYGNFDKPLGRFLRDDLFDQSYKCPACDSPPEAHVHCYTHKQGSLTIVVKSQEESLKGEKDGKIWMWHLCQKCASKNNAQPTRRVVLSDAAWGLSFGKFLELSFSNHAAASRAASCGHSLHRDCLRFYGFGRTVACFQYLPIHVHSVCLPPPKLMFNEPAWQEEWFKNEASEVADNAELFFAEVFDSLRQIGEKIANSGSLDSGMRVPELRRVHAELEKYLQKEKSEFEEMLQQVVPDEKNSGQLYADILDLNRLRLHIRRRSFKWDKCLRRFDSSLRLRRSFTRLDSGLLEGLDSPTSRDTSHEKPHNSIPSEGDDMVSNRTISPKPENTVCGLNNNDGESTLDTFAVSLEKVPVKIAKRIKHVSVPCTQNKKSNEQAIPTTDDEQKGLKSMADNFSCLPTASQELHDHEIADRDVNESCNDEVCSVSKKAETTNSGAMIKSTEHSEEAPKKDSEINLPVVPDLSLTLDEAWTGKGTPDISQTMPMIQKVQESTATAVLCSQDSDQHTPSSLLVQTGSTPLASKMENAEIPKKLQNSLKSVESFKDSLSRTSSFNLLSAKGLLSSSTSFHRVDSFSGYIPSFLSSIGNIESRNGARILLQVGVDDTVINVREDEPTSIIAYALVSHDYHAKLAEKCKQKEKERDTENELVDASTDERISSSPKVFDSSQSYIKEKTASPDDIYSVGNKWIGVPDYFLQTKDMHIKVSLSEETQYGKVKHSVNCYFAKQFEDLRKRCCPVDKDYVRSLSRCKKWVAQGGKSNVFFAKTLDDRFIIKQVTKTELESFEKFAQDYFKYLTNALSSGSPTCLAKILGIYQVTTKRSGREVRIDVMVMENLLYGRNVTRVYDLKGSSRSRYNADKSGRVLFDQNLLEMIPTSPILVGNKAKRLLERAVWNDTSFLATITVMDYSLLVGIDEERHELVVGIIDFMRQYTWDKHLETWVKASGILGGTKSSPTVISPKEYKKRFRKAMATYFLVVPDQWSPLTLNPSESQKDLRSEVNTPRYGDTLNQDER